MVEEKGQYFHGHGAKGFYGNDEFEVCENPIFKNYFRDESYPNLAAHLGNSERPWLFKKMWKCYKHKEVPQLFAFAREFPYRQSSLTFVFYRWEEVPITTDEIEGNCWDVWQHGPEMQKTISTEPAHWGQGFNELRKVYQWLLNTKRLPPPNGQARRHS